MPGTVTFCVYWTSASGSKVQCEDVQSGEPESFAKQRALDAAFVRMTQTVDGQPPCPPLPGTTLTMQKHQGMLVTLVATQDVGKEWKEDYEAFYAECMDEANAPI